MSENKIDPKVASRLPKKIQAVLTFAEKDSWGKYHLVVNHPKFGEASFHGTNLGDMKWEVSEFIENGTRY